MNGKYKSLWLNDSGDLEVIDQTKLPHVETTKVLKTCEDATLAIADMTVRGAGVIGSVAAFGVYLAMRQTKVFNGEFEAKVKALKDARPTAVNLQWAVDLMLERLRISSGDLVLKAKEEAININNDEAEKSYEIGRFGADIIEEIAKREKRKVNILTHCNAGWLAVIDMGTALAPIYEAKRRGIDIHVWVDETRPRNQGANLTAWELGQDGVEHTIIADNTGGHLMQHGMVDMIIVGADRVSRQGDVANKIGTYLKALAAHANNVPFYVAFPTSTFDFEVVDGVKDIPIETRSEDEVRYMYGLHENGHVEKVLITPKDSHALNYGFDVTPNRYITGLITERGIIDPKLSKIEEVFKDLL
ncbi:S-methyl-5-thioribose-1-phosphate isomerase [Sulfuricurvum sp.]|uniref:S-methyl-5-thioribose-1-phosphate isomerase n=1 Tax=Sulfuricurvum sp. TaxID=2025608 RepID=UPI00286E85DF|nr:S-methyl-5-thioribose-1-phosphate isomerase [Sulfuricurvum sp.]